MQYKQYFRSADFKVRRMVWGFEVAPATGIRHLQGYVEFERFVRLSFVKDTGRGPLEGSYRVGFDQLFILYVV